MTSQLHHLSSNSNKMCRPMPNHMPMTTVGNRNLKYNLNLSAICFQNRNIGITPVDWGRKTAKVNVKTAVL